MDFFVVLFLLPLPNLWKSITKYYDPYQEIQYDSKRWKIPTFMTKYLNDTYFVEFPGLLHSACTPKVMNVPIGWIVKEDEYCARMQPEHFFSRNFHRENVVVFVPSLWHSFSVLYLVVVIFLFCVLCFDFFFKFFLHFLK